MRTITRRQLQPSRTLQGHVSGVRLIEFSPTGTSWFSADIERRINIWSGNEIAHQLDMRIYNERIRPVNWIRSGAFSHDGQKLFVAAGIYLTAIDVWSGHIAWQYQAPNMLCFVLTPCNAVAVDNHGRVVATFDSGRIELWTPEGRRLHRWKDNDCPRWIGITKDGDKIVGTDTFTVGVWDGSTQTKIARLTLKQRVHAFALAPDSGRWIVRTLDDVRIWNGTENMPQAIVPVHPGLPLVAVDRTGDWFAAGDADGLLIIDYSGHVEAEIRPESNSRIISAKFTPDGTQVATGWTDGTIRFYDVV